MLLKIDKDTSLDSKFGFTYLSWSIKTIKNMKNLFL